jgi:ketosteroid isomerase-like protein
MGEIGMSPQQQQQNKKLIHEGFDRWASNQGSFFDLLSDDFEWTITGTSPISKTYTSRKQFLDEVIAPLSACLSKQITPKVRALYADGVTLSLHFEWHSGCKKMASLTTIPARVI